MSATPDSGSPASDKAALAYDRIDSFLRNNLDDSDYADYSEALETVYAHPPAALPEGWLQDAEKKARALRAAAFAYGFCEDGGKLAELCAEQNEALYALLAHLKRAVP